MTTQELNGLTDWWNAGTNYFNESVEAAGEWVGSTVFDVYDWASTKSHELTETSIAQLKDFQDSVEKLFETQSEVDKALESIPKNSPEYQRLSAKREEARGIFSEYIMPAWKEFTEWAGFESQANFSGTLKLGAIPVGIAAVLGAVAVAGYYVSEAMDLEREILADPDLKKKYLETRGTSLINLAGMQHYFLIGGGLVAALMLYKVVKK